MVDEQGRMTCSVIRNWRVRSKSEQRAGGWRESCIALSYEEIHRVACLAIGLRERYT